MRCFLLILLLASLSISVHAQNPDFRIIGRLFDESNHGVERVRVCRVADWLRGGAADAVCVLWPEREFRNL